MIAPVSVAELAVVLEAMGCPTANCELMAPSICMKPL